MTQRQINLIISAIEGMEKKGVKPIAFYMMDAFGNPMIIPFPYEDVEKYKATIELIEDTIGAHRPDHVEHIDVKDHFKQSQN